MSDKHTDALLAALERITEVAGRCDSWESFPSSELDAANEAIALARRASQVSAAAPADLDKLEALARAATPGPWAWASDWDRAAVYSTTHEIPAYKSSAINKRVVCSGNQNNSGRWSQENWSGADWADAKFIAEANPVTILQLIAKIRASEGQAQTSAVRSDAKVLVDVATGVIGQWNMLETYDKEMTERFCKQLEREFAAQLADSTATGAPELSPLQEKYDGLQLAFRATCTALKHTQDKLSEALLAAPTAQQSLTAGGAVPEGLVKAAAEFLDSANALQVDTDATTAEALTAFDRTRSRLQKALAAAPLPQVQSEALDAKQPHGHREDYYLMANARLLAMEPIHRIRTMQNWVLAKELFATGSTSAHEICIGAGIDPDGYRVERAADQQPVTPSGALEKSCHREKCMCAGDKTNCVWMRADNDGGVA